MKQLQFRIHRFVFKPSLIGTLAMLIFIPLFIKFGFWQYHKAQQKQSIQAAYHQAEQDKPVKFPVTATEMDAERWKYRRVELTGHYETDRQILLDNKVESNRAGYHVVTPFKLENSDTYVLVNRGWIEGKTTHSELPTFNTPVGTRTITGQVWIPSAKIFTLEDAGQTSSATASGKATWQLVWQNMDMARYQKSVTMIVSPLAVKLDSGSQSGGFVRNWEVPADRITTHLGYAYQWFGFAVATLLIYIYMSFSRVKPD